MCAFHENNSSINTPKNVVWLTISKILPSIAMFSFGNKGETIIKYFEFEFEFLNV